MSAPRRIAASRPYRVAWALAELRGSVALPFVGVPGAWMATGGGERLVVVPLSAASGFAATALVIETPMSLREAAAVAACAGCPPVYRRAGEGDGALAAIEFHIDGRVPVRVTAPGQAQAWADAAPAFVARARAA